MEQYVAFAARSSAPRRGQRNLPMQLSENARIFFETTRCSTKEAVLSVLLFLSVFSEPRSPDPAVRSRIAGQEPMISSRS